MRGSIVRVSRDVAAYAGALTLLVALIWLRSHFRADGVQFYAYKEYFRSVSVGKTFGVSSARGLLRIRIVRYREGEGDVGSTVPNWHFVFEPWGSSPINRSDGWPVSLEITQARRHPLLVASHYGWWRTAVHFAGFDIYRAPGAFFMIVLPWWFIVALLLGIEWVLLRKRVRAWRRRRRGLCAQCGYDLRGGDAGRCPECGFSWTVRTSAP